ncbi:DUF4301 family protein [Halosquirtibacter xylanolyticus]|uniref:DUF4301 family protein n=1 Tax=Halosquirtibacter xylanolyticus TaxID=3374599 RepID=UPI0037486DA6|nr:DUF4301 family protein [Prolixibacteraceae bacterium]
MMTNKLTDQNSLVSEKQIQHQLQQFIDGFPSIVLKKSATIGDGIRKYDNTEVKNNILYYQNEIGRGLKVEKFVPASGAATRMFKHLFELKEQLETGKSLDLNDSKTSAFFSNLTKFAFFKELCDIHPAAANIDIDNLSDTLALEIIDSLLTSKGLNYGNLPKGVLKFHLYEDEVRTPLEEHLFEAAHYGMDKNRHCAIHFTVSPEHQSIFKELTQSTVPVFEKKYDVKYDITFSTQKKSTDTIAVNPDNTPFINDDGTHLFRPGGHGALIENLDDLDAEMIFIKNIDNVTVEDRSEDTTTYKKLLAGVLLKERDTIFSWLRKFDDNKISTNNISILENYVLNKLCVILPEDYPQLEFNKKKDLIYTILNRPIRVCGMVKNEGEPGGGPFWAKNNHNIFSLQIVESSQMDHNDYQQQTLINGATHFNPVDLVCYTRDYHGNNFNLKNFIDPETGFISHKSKNGRQLKALELPGLWNGAMANWSTIFVEVPLSTFSPVKEVNDLLRKEHQL